MGRKSGKRRKEGKHENYAMENRIALSRTHTAAKDVDPATFLLLNKLLYFDGNPDHVTLQLGLSYGYSYG